MKIAIKLFVLLTLVIPGLAQTAKPTIDGINWLAGCWESNQNGRISRERWTKPLGKMMLSTSQMVKNGKTVSFEFLRIVEDDSGLYYISKPSENKEETSFKLIKFSSTEVVFENPEHDFPQRIIYRLESDKSLFARIEGKNKGKEMGVDFPMKRAACD
jgi:hypothetical protein